MLLFVGLGNPGDRYVNNRHNVGFMAVQAIASRHNIAPWRRKFQGVAVEGMVGGDRTLLLLPGTFMNESGRAVAEAVHFYKIGLSDIVVFHDELDLPPAKLAGQNRRRQCRTTYCARSRRMSARYRRVRIGIGHPGDKKLGAATCCRISPRTKAPGWKRCVMSSPTTPALLAEGKDRRFRTRCISPWTPKVSAERRTRIKGRSWDSNAASSVAERRQVDPFNALHADGRGAGGELSVLHHRAECRRDRGA